MTINCNLRILLAKVNVERAKQGKPILSLRQLAKETGVSLSVLASLNTRRSRRIDLITLDRRLRRASPTPGLGSQIELSSGDAGGLLDLRGVGKALSSQRITPEEAPPALL